MHCRFLMLPPLVVLATVTVAAAQQVMHAPATTFELSADEAAVPIRLVDEHVVFDVTLDGKGPFPFIFDTGAHGSVMDLAFAREQGLALGAEVTVGSPSGRGRPGQMVTIGAAGMGGLTLKNLTCVAFDGLPFPRTATSPRGVLGPYGLAGLLVTLDYPGQRLVFRRGALPEPDGREVFGWDRNRGLPEIPATVAGTPVVLHLDSGAPGGLSLPTALASQLVLQGPLVDMGYSKLVDTVSPVRGATLRGTFTIGRYELANPTVRFVDIAKNVGNVGAAVLKQLAITIDPANARLRLTGPANGRLEATEVPKVYYGVQFDAIDANPPQVLVVDRGSPAEKSGLRAGDRIVRFNGRPLDAVDVNGRVEALRKSPLQVTVQRGQDTLDVTMALH